jgi:hypothetical protein
MGRTSSGTSIFSKSTEVSSILGLDGLKWKIPRPFAKKRVPLVIDCTDDRRDEREDGRMNDDFTTRRKTNDNFTDRRSDNFTNRRSDNFTNHQDLRTPGNHKSKSISKSKSKSKSKKKSQKPSTGEVNEFGLLCCLGPFCAENDTDSSYFCSTIKSFASTGVDGDDTSQPGQYLYVPPQYNDDISAMYALSSSGDDDPSNENRATKYAPSNNAVKVKVNMMPAAPRRLRNQQQQLRKQREVRFAAERVQMKAREVEAAQKQFDVLMKQAKEAKRKAEESAKMKIIREAAVVAEKRYETELARGKQENDRELAALKSKLAKARRTQGQQDIKDSKANGYVFTSSAFARKTVAYTNLAGLKKSWTLSTGSSSRQSHALGIIVQ